MKSWVVALLLLISSSALAAAPLQVFGGHDHKTYLGCLTCSEMSPDSIMNPFSTYGNQFNPESIMNQFGEYGSRFGMYSACNAFALDPPVIVDKNGNYYRRLSVNDMVAIKDRGIRSWIKGIGASH